MTSYTTQTSFARRRSATPTGTVIAGFQRAGMLDWPGKVTATVFLGGCPLACPYCHNPELIGGTRRPQDLTELLAHLRDRRDWLDGVVVTGGEPTADPVPLFNLLTAVRAEGLPIKLDTNGTRPDVLTQVLDESMVEFIALDVKATPERYERASGRNGVWESVDRSIDLVLGSGIDHEFRTTCYPLAVGPDDLVRIAARLRGGRRYVLQQFRPHRTLDPAAVSVRPLAPETLARTADRCSAHLPTVLRGA